MDETGVEPLDVPGLGVPVEDLVADGGDGQQHRGSNRDCQGEAAAPERDLVDPEVGGVGVRQELLILLSPASQSGGVSITQLRVKSFSPQ